MSILTVDHVEGPLLWDIDSRNIFTLSRKILQDCKFHNISFFTELKNC